MNPSFDPDLPLPVGNFLLPAEGVIEMHPFERQGLGASRPTRTVVQVPELHYGYLVEVDAIAVIASDAPARGAGNSAV